MAHPHDAPPTRRRDAGRRGRLRRHWRWGVVAVLVGTLCAMPSLVAAWPVDEPDVSTETLVQRIATSTAQPYEGLFESRGGVRLPDLGRFDDQVRPFTERTRVRVFYSAPNRWRADELTPGGEVGWYREPDGLWRWATGRQRVLYSPRTDTEPLRFPRMMDLSPPELGRRVMRDGVDERVERIDARRIAGVEAVGLRITPIDPARSTIESISLWADPDTGVVLRVEVDTGGTVPIFETAFLDLSFSTPADDVLTFEPEETGIVFRTTATMDALETVSGTGFIPLPDSLGDLPERSDLAAGVKTYGSGFSVVSMFVVPQGTLGRRVAALPESQRPWGGEAVVVDAGLVNVQIVDDAGLTYVLTGTVPMAELDRLVGSLLAPSSAPGGP